MITLAQLVKIAPFSEETRNGLLQALDNMTDNQKFRLSETCWASLSALFQNRLQKTMDEMILEMSQGKKQYTKNDFQEVKAKLIYEFIQKLEASENQEDIQIIKSRLESIKNTPNS